MLNLLRWHWTQNIEQKNERLKTKDTDMKNQITERFKPGLENGRKCRLEQNNVLNKIMSTCKCIKYNFITPLKCSQIIINIFLRDTFLTIVISKIGINWYFSLIFYLVMKRFLVTKNSVIEIPILVINHESWPVKPNIGMRVL